MYQMRSLFETMLSLTLAFWQRVCLIWLTRRNLIVSLMLFALMVLASQHANANPSDPGPPLP